VTCAELEVPANQNKGELVIKVAKDSPVQFTKLSIIGRAVLGDKQLERRATMQSFPGEPPTESVRLACSLATPFKFKSQYEFRYIARGGALKKV
jgi:hypothetical protein